MAEFLSPDWIAALDGAVRDEPHLTETAAGSHLVVQQQVTGAPTGDLFWHLVVDDGSVRILPGPAEHPDVTFRQDVTTATAVASGATNAQTAFMMGRIHIGGTVGRLIENRDLFEDIDTLFSDVFADTTFPEEVPGT